MGVYISRTIFLKRKRDPINSGTMNPVRYHGTRNVNLYRCGEQLAGRDLVLIHGTGWAGSNWLHRRFMKTKIHHLLPNGKFISSLGVIGEQNEELFRGVEKNGAESKTRSS